MRAWLIIGATILGMMLVGGGLWYRIDGPGQGFAHYTADDVIAAMRAEGITVTEVVTAPPDAQMGANTVAKRVTIAAGAYSPYVLVLAFARDSDRSQTYADLSDPKVAALAHVYTRGNIVIWTTPGVPDDMAARCQAALARLK